VVIDPSIVRTTHHSPLTKHSSPTMHPQEIGAQEFLANLSVGYVLLAAFVLTILRLALVPNRAPFARSVAELVESLIIAGVLVFLVIRPFFLQAFFIPSESMEPTLLGHDKGYNSTTNQNYTDTVHDHIFVDKLSYRLREPRRDEIIVFKAEKKADIASRMENREPVENVLIKRLRGLPGDKLEIKLGSDDKIHVFINDKQLSEPFIKEEMQNPQPGSAEYAVRGPIVLGREELFVMGDNRNNSNDSRFWGTLPRNRVIGRAMLIFWPLSRIRLIR
jgi:signal peptidase I